MEKNQRAKIFMPFDALKGLREAFLEKERIVVPKRDLTEDDINELNYVFSIIKIGDMVECVYYDNDEYVSKKGLISKINFDGRVVQIVKEKINFDNIYSLKIIEI